MTPRQFESLSERLLKRRHNDRAFSLMLQRFDIKNTECDFINDDDDDMMQEIMESHRREAEKLVNANKMKEYLKNGA